MSAKMSEETVCPSWTVQYTLKRTEASTLRCTENLHAQINTCCSTLVTHWSTSWGSSEPLTIGLRWKKGMEREQKGIRGALKTCGYPNWTFVKTSKRFRADREEETRRREKATTCSGGSWINVTSRSASNLATGWGRNLSILGTKHSDIIRVMRFMLFNSARTAQAEHWRDKTSSP